MKVGMYIANWDINMGTYGQLLPPNNTPVTSNYAKLRIADLDLSYIDYPMNFVFSIIASGILRSTGGYPAEDMKLPFNYNIHTNHNKPILLSIGGAGSRANWIYAMQNNRAAFMQQIWDLYDSAQFDGVDIDVEPVTAADEGLLLPFIDDLYTGVQSRPSAYTHTGKGLLTTATIWQASMWLKRESKLDAIFMMTYDLAGNWIGKTWYNAAIYTETGDVQNAGDYDIYNSASASIQRYVHSWLNAGWPRNKLFAGIPFYGYTWKSIPQHSNPTIACNEPRQIFQMANYPNPVASDISLTGNRELPEIYAKIAAGAVEQWDASAHVPWLTVATGNVETDEWVNYVNEQYIEDAVAFAHNENLGGIFVYDINNGVLAYGITPQQPLAIAFKNALLAVDSLTNKLTAKGKELVLSGELNWLTDTFKVALLDTRWTHVDADISTYSFLGDLPTGVVKGSSSALTGKTISGTTLDATDTTVSISNGTWVHKVVLYKDTGVEATSPIILALNSISGLPFKTIGTAEIKIVWPNTDSKIIKL